MKLESGENNKSCSQKQKGFRRIISLRIVLANSKLNDVRSSENTNSRRNADKHHTPNNQMLHLNRLLI